MIRSTNMYMPCIYLSSITELIEEVFFSSLIGSVCAIKIYKGGRKSSHFDVKNIQNSFVSWTRNS